MIYLMRHAEAVRTSDAGDQGRWLSARGRVEAKSTAEKIRAKSIVIDAIMCSPLVRAVQTAEIVSHVLGIEGEIKTSISLRPESLSEDANNAIREAGEHVLVLSHEDLVSRLCAFISGTTKHYATAEIRALSRDKLHWVI